MIKRSFADSIAVDMKSVLESPEYKQLFKSASAEEEKEEKEESKDENQSHDGKDAADSVDADDCSMADDAGLDALAQYDIAVDSLLVASAALDEIGTETGSKGVIRLASLVVEAKKKKVEELNKLKKEKAKGKDKDKKEKDKQMSKDKAWAKDKKKGK